MSIMDIYLTTALIKHDASFTVNGINYDAAYYIPVGVKFSDVDLVTINKDGSHVYITTAD